MGRVENYFYFLCIYLLLKLFCLVVPEIITFSKLLLVLLCFPLVFPQNISFHIFDQFLTSFLASLRISQSTLSRLGLNFLNKLTFNFSAISRSNHLLLVSFILAFLKGVTLLTTAISFSLYALFTLWHLSQCVQYGN